MILLNYENWKSYYGYSFKNTISYFSCYSSFKCRGTPPNKSSIVSGHVNRDVTVTTFQAEGEIANNEVEICERIEQFDQGEVDNADSEATWEAKYPVLNCSLNDAPEIDYSTIEIIEYESLDEESLAAATKKSLVNEVPVQSAGTPETVADVFDNLPVKSQAQSEIILNKLVIMKNQIIKKKKTEVLVGASKTGSMEKRKSSRSPIQSS